MPKMLSTTTTFGPDNWRIISSVKQPGLTFLLFEFWYAHPVGDWWDIPPGMGGFSKYANRRQYRHLRGRTDNFLFIDGHVVPLVKDEDIDGTYITYYHN